MGKSIAIITHDSVPMILADGYIEMFFRDRGMKVEKNMEIIIDSTTYIAGKVILTFQTDKFCRPHLISKKTESIEKSLHGKACGIIINSEPTNILEGSTVRPRE